MDSTLRIVRAQNNLRGITPQYKKNYKYWNPEGSPAQNVSLRDYTKYLWQATKLFFFRPKEDSSQYNLQPDVSKKQLEEASGGDSLTWLGHSTFLLKLDNVSILFDPFLERRASFCSFLGPQRVTPCPLDIPDLGRIDVVVISHDHYDHLCVLTLKKILDHNSQVKFIVPLGVKTHLSPLKCVDILELDWMDKAVLGTVEIQLVPAIHWSKRLFKKINNTLWGGYRISSQEKSLFFSGDTAYGDVFKELGKLNEGVDYALLPIGCYDPAAIMKAHHANPEEAMKIASDLKAKRVVAMHWGTIELAHEPIHEPPSRFRAGALSAGYAPDDIWVMSIGETRALK